MHCAETRAIVSELHGFRLHAGEAQFRLRRMIKNGFRPRFSAIGAKLQMLSRYKLTIGLAAAVLFSVAAGTSSDQPNPDEQYIYIMSLIDRADALRKAGQADAARVKYQEAKTNLMNFKARNPLYEPKSVKYRLNEVTERADFRPVEPSKTKLESETPVAKSPVKLTEPGAEPRLMLRFHPKAGDTQQVTMTLKMTVDTGVAGTPPITIPMMTMPMDLSVKSVSPSGDISYESVIGTVVVAEDTNLPPQALEGIKASLAGFKGVTVAGIMSDRGITKKLEVKAGAGTNPQVQQALEGMKEGLSDMGLPLPDESVGAGAKWEVKKPGKFQGLTAENTESFQLISADGDHISASFTVGQTASRQSVQIIGNTTGTNVLDLSKVMPMQVTASSHVEINSGDSKKQPMVTDTSFQIQSQ
jgi:hypothetical protein